MQWFTEITPGVPLDSLHGCVATLGVFDGVHLGHRAILDRTMNWARTESRPAVVITFSIHPDRVVRGEAPPLLMSLDHRRRELERCGLDATIALEFNDDLRRWSATEFVDQVLIGCLGIHGLVLGHDTALGRNRQGDAAFLDRLGKDRGFAVAVVGEIAIDGAVVSSTNIREALAQGNLEQAAALLGRAPSLLGTVVPGQQRGRALGFPTANLDVSHECVPANGVYAVIALWKGQRLEGICNIGHRPTFEARGQRTVEVHLLDLDADLYGEPLELIFVARLRPERRFPGVEQLREQLVADRAAAIEVFRRSPSPQPGP